MTTGVAGFLARLTGALTSSGVNYMLSGSFASTYYGVPRTTHDLDLVVDFTPGTLGSFLRQLPDEEYYVSAEAAKVAVRSRGQFNVIDFESGWKVDLIQKKMRPYSEVEFKRRVPVELFDVPIHIASPEDVVLSKLEWAMKAESARQLRDVIGVIEVSGTQLDYDYIESWVATLGVSRQWAEVQAATRSSRI